MMKIKNVDNCSFDGTEVDSEQVFKTRRSAKPIAKPNVMRSCIQEENLYTPNCIRTFSGIYMNVFEPTIEMICIEDIAHALSHQCRFGGHLPDFYSVAQHCILMSERMHESHQLAALLHDASEAYLLDIPSPIKKGLINYKDLEDNLMNLIAKRFGFEYPLHEKVKEVDNFMLQWEWSTLMLNKRMFPPIKCISSTEAKEMFFTTFKELWSVTA